MMKRFFYPRIDSTNLGARRLVHNQSEKPPFWVLSHDQYAGRGHNKNTWESSPNMNFLGTFIFIPENFEASRQFVISQLVSLGIVKFLELFIDNVKIKWPNDIYFGDDKIAGILIENEIAGANITLSSIGVGVNINQVIFKSEAPNPISLKQISGLDYHLEEVSRLLEENIEHKLKLIQTSKGQIENEYLKHLYRFKQFAPYRSDNKWFEARIIGIGEFGELLLEDKSGKVQSFGFKEVEFILS